MQTPFLLYKTENNDIKVDVRLENETLWLNQKQMAELFATERSVITITPLTKHPNLQPAA